jgi:hypothetical protein
MEAVALAVCILNALNSRFPKVFRKDCPLTPPPGSLWELVPQHIDNLHPEVVVLAALILARGFVDDISETTATYKETWGQGLWSCDQINHAQQAILENIEYRIMPLWTEVRITEALRCMKLAGEQHEPVVYDDEKARDEQHKMVEKFSFRLNIATDRPMSSGKAVKGLAQQLTPAETPKVEDAKGTSEVSSETRAAFSGELEPFPAYFDSGLRI